MSNCLLESKVKEIQLQYLDLLKDMMPMIDDEKYVEVALDSISLFWRKKKPVIDMYLQYVVKEKNTVFYTAATYFDVENGEQYPFLLMGDLHIFDDPLGRYCEICHHFKDAPKALAEKVSICAKDNIDILERCEELVLVLPLRFMGTSKEEHDFSKIGEDVFCSFFNNIPDMNSYQENCSTIDEIVEHFKCEYQDTVCLFEYDNENTSFKDRVKKAIDIQKELVGDGYEEGAYFYFALFGPLQQAIDILLVAASYNAVPLIRYPVALHNAYLLLPNFFKENHDEIEARVCVFNSLYKMFDQSAYLNESLSEFYDRVKKFSFEKKALTCYKAGNPKQTLESLHFLVEDFNKYKA